MDLAVDQTEYDALKNTHRIALDGLNNDRNFRELTLIIFHLPYSSFDMRSHAIVNIEIAAVNTEAFAEINTRYRETAYDYRKPSILRKAAKLSEIF